MLIRTSLVLSYVIALPFMAAAVAPETSPRPKSNPYQEYTQLEAKTVLATSRSLRPQLRPITSQSSSVTPVATSNPAFDTWIRGFRARARSAGISSSVFDRAFQGVSYNSKVISLDRNQAEFKRQIWDYLDSAASPERVDLGRKALKRNRRTLERIEAAYGVEKEVVTAVWGLESRYGERKGDIPVIEALATLAFDGRRGAFFEKQLIAALKILQTGHTRPENMKGSWAGAMGHTQFIPTSFQAYAVDFTGDGRRDIWSDDPSDALASTAAYLKRFGWVTGMPWGVEVRVPKSVNPGDAKRKPSDWAKRGVVGIDGKPVRDYGLARILQPAGKAGASFMVFKNFDVIKRYNNADAYAIGVGHLGDRIGGGPEIQASWPRGYEPVSFAERKEIQRKLKQRGYPLEKIDGIIGPNTRKSIIAFQKSIGVEQDGFPSKQVLQQLRKR
ncbi:MAG: lytic murein transglycosylase [Pseudomonadota bacterium]